LGLFNSKVHQRGKHYRSEIHTGKTGKKVGVAFDSYLVEGGSIIIPLVLCGNIMIWEICRATKWPIKRRMRLWNGKLLLPQENDSGMRIILIL